MAGNCVKHFAVKRPVVRRDGELTRFGHIDLEHDTCPRLDLGFRISPVACFLSIFMCPVVELSSDDST